MRLTGMPFVGALLLTASMCLAVTQKPAAKSSPLDRFKRLEGTWSNKTGGQAMSVSYKITSGGTAVVETIGAGSGHEMITVITEDGDGLALTHFCMLGNQPQMHAAGPFNGKSIAFDFVRATNLKSPKQMHMHSVTYTFADKDTLKADWTNYNEGKPAGTASFDLTRKK